MNYIDLILLVVVGAFVFYGLFFGLVRTLGSLVGTIVAIIFTDRLIDPAFHTFGFIFGNGTVARVIIFLLIFFVVSRLVGLVFWIVEKIWGIFSWIPFAKSIDRLLGGLFGFIEGVLVTGVILFFALNSIPSSHIKTMTQTSQSAKYLIQTGQSMEFFLPADWKKIIETAADSTANVIPKK